MTCFDPELASVPACSGAEMSITWKPQPGFSLKFISAFGEGTFEHEKFSAALQIKLDSNAWSPTFQSYVLPLVREQRYGLDGFAVCY